MKQGKSSLMALAQEIERQRDAKEDLVANTLSLRLDESGDRLAVQGDSYHLLDNAHRQIGDRVKIPAKYYSRMRDEAPGLLATNVNHWFNQNPEKRMIRLLDGRVRAFLSDRYQRRDNFNLLKYVWPTLSEIGSLQVTSCEVTESKFYLKMTTPRIQTEVRRGDVVQAGLVISNSEVGLGAFNVQPMILRKICANGMIANDYGIRKYHIGKRIDTELDVERLYTDETLQADEHAFWLKARDVVKGALSEDLFHLIVNDMRDASERRIEVKPAEAVKRLSQKYSLTQDESDGVLQSLLSESDITQYGAVNAITHYSKGVEQYDRATELEELAGQVLTLKPGEWKEIAA